MVFRREIIIFIFQIDLNVECSFNFNQVDVPNNRWLLIFYYNRWKRAHKKNPKTRKKERNGESELTIMVIEKVEICIETSENSLMLFSIATNDEAIETLS